MTIATQQYLLLVLNWILGQRFLHHGGDGHEWGMIRVSPFLYYEELLQQGWGSWRRVMDGGMSMEVNPPCGQGRQCSCRELWCSPFSRPLN